MFMEPEETKVFETDCLAAAPNNSDEVKMDVKKGYGAKDTPGPLSSVNLPISVAAPNTLSSNIDSRYVFQPKHPPFHKYSSLKAGSLW